MNGQGKDYGPSVRTNGVADTTATVLTAPPNQASPVLSGSRPSRQQSTHPSARIAPAVRTGLYVPTRAQDRKPMEAHLRMERYHLRHRLVEGVYL